MNKRVHVCYVGQVQGVSFRFSAKAIALELGLLGWVKNLPDGRVELVCEGKEEDLHKVLDKIDSEFSGYIRKKKVSWMPATDESSDFTIEF